jgi:prepilin signal peptidase PulO-like enzyme (type II secretory pathway)
MCPKCKKKISWYDNIPVLSFFILRGRCRYCHKSISLQYPAVEIIIGVLFVLALYNHQANNWLLVADFWLLIRNLFFISILTVIFIYDLRWYLILDIITVPAMIVALILNLFLEYPLQNLFLAAVIGAGFFLFQYIISRGKWIGGGDIRMGALMGFMLGYPGVITGLMLSYIFGSIIGIILLIAGRKKMSSQIPFGTFLSAATIITLLYGQKILVWYMNLAYLQ